MGNCHSAGHIAEDHIHTDITGNIEEPQQKYRLGTVSNRLLGLNLTCLTGFRPRPLFLWQYIFYNDEIVKMCVFMYRYKDLYTISLYKIMD